MNSRRIFILSCAILILISVPVYFLMNGPSARIGKVLGNSVNNFYSQKTIKVSPLPKRNDDISDPNILAGSVVLMDGNERTILYSKNPQESVPIASVTKVMTALVSMDLYGLSDIVEAGDSAVSVAGSKIFLKKGEKMKVEDLLYGLPLNSGNDAAYALANGKLSQADFVTKMNEKAKELGMKETEYKDPAGLDDTGRSSARDIAFLFTYALKNETFKKIVSTPDAVIQSIDKSETHELKNSNRLTTGEISLEGIIGGKTGFTPDAGHGLVSAAVRNAETLISVVLKTNSNAASASAEESKKLLDWGFGAFDFNRN